ncbi:SAM-dependent methyltransferase [Steroidobacter sp.]|uniref:SAM-dependent methyltransferase n=1 Tax=Steroidobacter sp. TaxID=1978227 RepID=UPI001A3F2E8B|nr:class I SAM-dependent methyltransferase [Steroidobacter sp.]MBL8270693.1 class I SAM-dependent methyltransferase [Steroidobacter sp.]
MNGVPAPDRYVPDHYWEDRARRFAAQGSGLAAVCSYGMPEFYNRMIHWSQYLALRPWLDIEPGTRVLDVGCGVGRWSSLLAQRGGVVTGMDLSPTMIAEAQRRAEVKGVASRCRFLVQDLAQLDAGEAFDLIVGVTVLQHILDPKALRSAVQRMADHLAPGGRMVLLEAAPATIAEHCDTTVFRARQRHVYLDLFKQTGFELRAISGVDPAPFKTWLLPHLRGLPRALGMSALAGVTLLSTPIDVLFGRFAVQRSWHAVFVLQRTGDDHAA